VVDLCRYRRDQETGLDVPEKIARGNITFVSVCGKSKMVQIEEVIANSELHATLTIEIEGASCPTGDLLVVRKLSSLTADWILSLLVLEDACAIKVDDRKH
jgi:hypothetical protein